MPPPDCILALCYAVDQERRNVPNHPDAQLSPSAVVTLARLHAMQGGGPHAFDRWLPRDALQWLPQGPERTLLLAAPTVLGVADTSGIEWMHPRRAGRSPAQSGHKGQSKPRWM